MVGFGVDETYHSTSCYYVHIGFVHSLTENGAERIAAHTAPKTLDEIGVEDGGMESVQFIAWVNKLRRGRFYKLCGASGDTQGCGLTGFVKEVNDIAGGTL
jgi:hypothetical protein